MLRETLHKNNVPIGGWLNCGASGDAVTSEIGIRQSDTLAFIDTCGMDDPNPKRSDDKLMIEIFEGLMKLLDKNSPKGLESESYFNGLLFVTMANVGGRIEYSTIRPLFNMLMGLTLTYKTDMHIYMPFVRVLVSNMSKFGNDESESNLFFKKIW